jgi:hypothetical protein
VKVTLLSKFEGYLPPPEEARTTSPGGDSADFSKNDAETV